MNTSLSVSVHLVFRFDHDVGSNVEPHPRTSIRSQEPKHWPSGELDPSADKTRGTWVTHFCLETLDRSWTTSLSCPVYRQLNIFSLVLYFQDFMKRRDNPRFLCCADAFHVENCLSLL